MPLGLFVFLAALSIVSALGVIVQRNPVHSLLSLVLTLIAIALLFIAQGAVVVGLLQVIVYVGAIMVLFLFVIWLLNLQTETDLTGHLALKLLAAVAASALVAELWVFLLPPHFKVRWEGHPAGYGSMASLSQILFGDYLMAFEVTSVLLLAAIVGAIALARRTQAEERAVATQRREERVPSR